MASSSSSSSAAALQPRKYDVFISFRGEDTRRNFTSHLRDALRGKQIETYMDDRLERGDEISPALSKAIEESHISVVVFSQNYASSKWCLDELVKILECRNMGQDVIPVFYTVDPSHVRNQTGSYEEAFAKHKGDLKCNEERLNTWKKALVDAATIAGWDSQAHGDDSNLIQMIVEDVLRKLEYKYPPQESKCTFGIKENLEPIESSFREVRTVGIWGMGCIGKTTIAKCLFHKYSSQYEGSYFLANMREKSGMDSQALCNEVVSKLLGESERTNNVDLTFAKTRLSRKKVLLVLDDVSTSRQLKDLVEKLELQNFELSSRVIITSRDKHVLINGGVHKIHIVKELNLQESLRLFSLNAFKQNLPIEGYEELSKRAVDYAKGVPLALNVLGSFLQSRSKNEWESALTKLKKIPNEEIQSVLRLSYDGLNNEEKEMFLDIACFFKGDDENHVISLLDDDFYASIGLRTLQDKALITIEYGAVQMHDLIQEMGREIVREESIKEPGRRSRLWDPKEVYDVLKYSKELTNLKELDLSGSRWLTELPDFSKASNLETVDLSRCESLCHLHQSLLSLHSLINLCLAGCAKLKSLESEIHLRSLEYLNLHGCSSVEKFSMSLEVMTELDLIDTRIDMLPSSIGRFSQLTDLELQGLRLKNLPIELSCLRNLETLFILNCSKLMIQKERLQIIIDGLRSLTRLSLRVGKYLFELPDNICVLSLLEELDLSGSNIECLPANLKQLTSLKDLTLDHCERLRCLPELPQCITNLYLSGTNIECLPANLKQLTSLKDLRICDCKRFQCLPELPQCITYLDLSGSDIECLPANFKQLTSLKHLAISHCQRLRCLPELPQCITDLYLSGTNIECLPASIKQLTSLKTLSINDCKRLHSLPELSQSVERLWAGNCTSLETARLWTEMNLTSVSICFENCTALDEHSVSSFLEGSYLSIKHTAEIVQRYLFGLSICLPERRVPEWFKNNRTTGNFMTIELDQTLQIVAFAFCAVLSPFHPKPPNISKFPGITCLQHDQGKIVRYYMGHYSGSGELNADTVFLWYEGASYISRSRTTCLFEFKPNTRDGPSLVLIKECGVYPIYGPKVISHRMVRLRLFTLGKKGDYVKVQRK